jgi:thioesterase domain-containing protein
LPLKVLFESPTVAELAARVAARQEQTIDLLDGRRSFSYVVELQRGDRHRPPIFLFPGGGGGEPEFFIYARLARRVGRKYSFYALRARGADGIAKPHARVEEMASDYIHEIRRMQPHGPYFLLGECFGGVAAYETAHRLRERGERVALLALLDAERPTKKTYLHYRMGRWLQPLLQNYFLRRIPFHWKAWRALDHRRRIPYLVDKLGQVLSPAAAPEDSIRNRTRGVVKQTANATAIEHVERSRDRYRRAVRWHKPKPYHGRVDLLATDGTCRRDRTLGWGALVRGGLEIHRVPGDHDSYIREHVEITAAKLRECLESAAGRETTIPE